MAAEWANITGTFERLRRDDYSGDMEKEVNALEIPKYFVNSLEDYEDRMRDWEQTPNVQKLSKLIRARLAEFRKPVYYAKSTADFKCAKCGLPINVTIEQSSREIHETVRRGR